MKSMESIKQMLNHGLFCRREVLPNFRLVSLLVSRAFYAFYYLCFSPFIGVEQRVCRVPEGRRFSLSYPLVVSLLSSER